MKKKIVLITGAGISAESGVSTFRDADGLWCNHSIDDVATPAGWRKDKQKVLDFYNLRWKEVKEVEPNGAHLAITKLEEKFDVCVITQNIDDLHERGGNSNVLHLHGEITKKRSSLDPNLIYDWNDCEIKLGDKCEKGSQMRPHVVWFTEAVPKMMDAIQLVKEADIMIICGTSLEVYPAASLIDYASIECDKYIVDPNPAATGLKINVIQKKAVEGLTELVEELLTNY